MTPTFSNGLESVLSVKHNSSHQQQLLSSFPEEQLSNRRDEETADSLSSSPHEDHSFTQS